MLPLIQISDLTISFNQQDETSRVVKNISLQIPRGKITALIGESGSGKSVTALSILQLLPGTASVSGQILFSEDGKEQQNLTMPPTNLIQQIRGNKIAMIFQEPMTSLNPVHTCGAQVMEALKTHRKISKKEALRQTVELFNKVELPKPEQMVNRYPHQISGGQKQRVMIAMAMSCNPSLLIADEPTTALDVRVQKNILLLLKRLQAENGMGILLITHDLSLVADVADEIAVMYKGELVEKGNVKDVLNNPSHLYTQALLACKPSAKNKNTRLSVVADIMEGKKNEAGFYQQKSTEANTNPILKVENLEVSFPIATNFFGTVKESFKAVDGVSFNVFKNETVGLVGESGCGKTTLGRAILGLVQPASGNIILKGKNIAAYSPKEMQVVRRDLQIVFQDPFGSLNPRLTIGEAIAEPMKVHMLNSNKIERKNRTVHLLEQVNMSAADVNRYPHQFSGGQRQRICIARALALDPDFIIFDESVSALDVSVQAQILNLINELKAAHNFTSIFISHDLSVIHYISDRVMVMQNGKIIEEGNADEIFYQPKENYTKELLNAAPGAKLIL